VPVARGPHARTGLYDGLRTQQLESPMTEGELMLAAEALSGIGGWALDGPTRQVQATPQTWRLLGQAPRTGAVPLDELLRPLQVAERARLQQAVEETLAHGARADIEFGCALPAAAPRRLRCVAVPGADGHSAHGTLSIVGARNKPEDFSADRRSRDLLERLQLCTEASGIGTWVRDLEADRVRWDDTMLALFGLPPGSAAPSREHYLALVHPEDRARMRQALEGWQQQPSGFEYQFRVLLPGGGLRWLQVRGRSQHDDAGRVLRRTGICFDITERRLAESAREQRERAAAAHTAKTEFLARMSHELRTPLNAVLGFAQLLAMDPQEPLSPGQSARVTHIQSAGWYLLALINDVLDLARIESHQAPLSPAAVALEALVDECLAHTAAAAAKRRVSLRRWPDAGPPLPTVWADRARLRQVLLNVLSFAVHHNPEGGVVELAADAPGPASVAVQVRHSGHDLTEAQVGQLFEPFNRLVPEPGSPPANATGSVQGALPLTGMGLALSKLLVEQMGGRIDARSEPGRGNAFVLTLPCAPRTP
jgi:PAS domain S-box-containing protein